MTSSQNNTDINKKNKKSIKLNKKIDMKNKLLINQDNSKELGGVRGPEPTRYGDWEVGGRCSDF